MFHSLIIGGLTVLVVHAMLSESLQQDEPKTESEERSFPINDGSGRYVTLSCQTCRKLKRHRELETNLFECVKCKRLTDIRIPS